MYSCKLRLKASIKNSENTARLQPRKGQKSRAKMCVFKEAAFLVIQEIHVTSQ